MFSFVVLALAAAAAARSLPLARLDSSLVARDDITLPSTFKWTSSDILVSAKNDTRDIAGIKDPSIIHYNNVYHVFASTARASGYNLVYFNFTDFSKASVAPFYYLDQSGIGTGYRAAPEVFYFAPQKLWYLIFQNGNAAYSTNKDISNPAGWTAPKTFYDGTPALIEAGLENGYWVDMWVICDEANCHLFSSDDNGRLYRSQTPVSNFPNGMSEPVIALQEDNKNDLFEASNVYAIGNSTDPTYLLLVECIGAGSSAGGQRYFRSWTSNSISGPWQTLAATQQNPFMGEANVEFANGNKWTKSISHGEIVRSDVDQRLRIAECGWKYMYQGIDPAASSADYNSLPWKLALLTQKGGC
ncbi:Nn.00g058400.m01.CDS01 [Neocucurbitaria sp. VM-36]